jgi:hypothetical protein
LKKQRSLYIVAPTDRSAHVSHQFECSKRQTRYLSKRTIACAAISVVEGQSRRFAPQKNSEPFRLQVTVKSVTDLPIGA